MCCCISQMVWFEELPDRPSAFVRERQMKEWQRNWKVRLIVEINPERRDLTVDIPL